MCRGFELELVSWFYGLASARRFWALSKLDVYPDDLLRELPILAGHKPIGVFDPLNALQGVLKGVDTVNLQEHPSVGFEGIFAIVTGDSTNALVSEHSATWVRDLVGCGISVLWIQSIPEQPEALEPSFFTARKGAGTIVVAQPFLLSDLAQNPTAQMNLVQLARRAIMPDRPVFDPFEGKF